MSTRELQAIGIPGLVGIGLALFCASFYFGTIAPMQAQLDLLNNAAQQLTASLRAGAPSATTGLRETPIAASETGVAKDPIEIIRRLNSAATTSVVALERSSYTISEKDGVKRMSINLPTKGSYPLIRTYLREALAVGRKAQIDGLLLQRARATDTVIDADLKLSFEVDTK